MSKNNDKPIEFLHVIGPDTKNSYGIMSQIHKNCDMTKHKFIVTAYTECRNRYPKLYEFEDVMFVPHEGTRLQRILFFYRLLKSAKHIVWHSLYFTTKKYLYFLYFFKSIQKKSTWIEWGADLYLWEYENPTFKQKILNYIGRKVREGFPNIGVTFPVNESIYRKQFGGEHRFFYTPMPNPMSEATGLLDFIDEQKPEISEKKRPMVQVAHNSFFFNNHIKLLNMLEQYKEDDIQLLIPLTYGFAGINGSFGGKAYLKAVDEYAKKMFGEKASVMTKNIPFDEYVKLLWKVDIAVFDFDRPCGLGNMRILLYMGKKVFIPGDNDFYKFLTEKGIQVFDTNKIPEMTYEEFIAPPDNTNLEWIRDYMNNDSCIHRWMEMFDKLAEND